MVYILELFRTKTWRGLGKFAYMDLKADGIDTSTGGTTIANAARQAHVHQHSLLGRTAEDLIPEK